MGAELFDQRGGGWGGASHLPTSIQDVFALFQPVTLCGFIDESGVSINCSCGDSDSDNSPQAAHAQSDRCIMGMRVLFSQDIDMFGSSLHYNK